MPAATPAPPAAEWRGVSRRFAGTSPDAAPALDDFSLAVQPGEFLTLLGPSGCGKTTALRLLSGLDVPDAGRVLLDGEDVTDRPPHRRAVNQVFQSYALFPHLRVGENIAFGLQMQRLPPAEIRARVARALELLALDGLADRRPDALSGGQRQRVALARALVCEPRVLLLDEPLSALDARLRAQVRGELRALQRRLRTTFVFVTHDQEEALTLSDRVAVLRAGRLEQVGSPEEIYRQPCSRFVAGFVGEANLLRARITGREDGHLACVLTGEGGRHALLAAGPDTPLPGAETTLLIRPEHVRVAPPPSPAGDSWAATVEERTFRGAGTTLLLRLDLARDGAPVRLQALVPAGVGASFDVGTAVVVSVPPEHVRLLPD